VSGADAAPEPGWVAPQLAAEFPELRCLSLRVALRGRRSDPGVGERLAVLADRFRGRRAVELRGEPVPAAYRVFYRQVGLDPDVRRTPIEEAAIVRLVEGGHRQAGLLGDALMLALLETGVPVTALDAARVDGPVGLRQSARGERLGRGPAVSELPRGRIVLADEARPLAELFGVIGADLLPGRATEELVLAAVRIPGVPEIHVEEALWTCQEALALE
jgi:DNA/RNA-binding domain of Phe-tRNA-synthetase-like protein